MIVSFELRKILCQLFAIYFLYALVAADTTATDRETQIISCEDKVSSCADRVLAGQCQAHPEWMASNCARACRFCEPAPEEGMRGEGPNYSCHDIDPKCHIRRLNGQCEEYLEWSRINCEWTCDLCQVESHLSDCEDKDELCEARAAEGQCNVNNIYMIRYCPKSCNLCHKKYRREKKIVVEEPEVVEIDEMGDPVVVADHCHDKYYASDCKRRKELGQCHSNAVWMHTNCWRTCGCQIHNFYPELHDLDDPDCVDTIPDCADLKEKNHCITHRPLMSEKCPKTCGLCTDSQTSVIPCINLEKDLCKGEISDDHCSRYPSHMLGCAADCGTCALIDPAVRCHPLVLGIDPFDFELLPGGISEMFLLLPTAYGASRHKVTVLSIDPWVIQIDNFIDKKAIEKLLSAAEGWISEATDDDTDSEFEDDSTLAAATSALGMGRNYDEADSIILSPLSMLFDLPMTHFEYVHVYHYKVGTSQKPSHEFVDEHLQHIYSNTFIAGILFLSDDVEGGEVKFPSLGKSVKPESGRLVLWAVAQDLNVTAADRRTEHMHLPVVRGNKYLAKLNAHIGDYRTTTRWRC